MPETEEMPPKFIADHMLGRLARWLRILGYDTFFAADPASGAGQALEDAAIARLAQAEDRWVLTRDTQFLRRRGLRGLLIEAETIEAQLVQVVRAFGLTSHRLFTRCLVCNTHLEEIAKPAVAGLVPPYVYRTQAQFRRCPACGRIYWRGTHWARMVERLLEI
jgi:uncharacterized protein with PIN domain